MCCNHSNWGCGWGCGSSCGCGSNSCGCGSNSNSNSCGCGGNNSDFPTTLPSFEPIASAGSTRAAYITIPAYLTEFNNNSNGNSGCGCGCGLL